MPGIALSPFVTMVESEDGMVFLHQRTGRYWQLNGTGSETVRLLLSGESVESAASRLQEKYPDASDHALSDVTELVRQLRAAKLIAR
ncbi:lasso peptide biosynthesis PqqD family chaperone [Kibdelosporangium persicum]|uniref:Coenzyme PQQ synthesis protein D (PqqD) n=1 Tax=Kibdelosporangium persicum TaxID=2698649 RepID=A0ABX2FFK0_9PSEU|nr:lasso peptide biosynthesis PqqD family chaperone [Kibdelosporangium persicum]NRN70166.1 Coenzyme PQQ synthesis protein D (PqqD) [Kibdelosporangium persicum]